MCFIKYLQYGDHIYWTDWQSEKIERASKDTGEDRTIIQHHLEGLMDIVVVAKDRQTGNDNDFLEPQASVGIL